MEQALTGAVFSDRFRIGRPLGRGSFAAVWTAEDLADGGREVALKILRAPASSVAVMQRFEREARVLEQLDHPAIVGGICFEKHEKKPYIAMELVDAPNLRKYARAAEREERTLTNEWLVTLFTDVCDAVDHAHGHGVIHRDLKPENILVVPGAPSARVLDFGVAKIIAGDEGNDATTIGRVVGTALYLAPEQVLGEPVDARTDVFALGALLFELLTQRFAWARDTSEAPMYILDGTKMGTGTNSTAEIMRRIVKARRPKPSDYKAGLAPELDDLVQSAMAVDPNRRPQSATQLADSVRRLLGPKSAPARSDTVPLGIESASDEKTPIIDAQLAQKLSEAPAELEIEERTTSAAMVWSVAGVIVLLVLLTAMWFLRGSW